MPKPSEEALKDYLEHVGLGLYLPAFQENGITSLTLLKMLEAPVGKPVKERIKAAILNGAKDGNNVVKRPGSELGANQVEAITSADVQAWMDSQEKVAPKTASEDPEIKAKQEKIAKAIDEVQKLREAIEKEALAEKSDRQKEVKTQLNAAFERFRKEGLGTFPSVKEDGKELDLVLKDAEATLQRVSKLTLEAVKRTEMTAVELIYAHQLLRGLCVDGNGATVAPGGELLAMPKRSSDADLLGPAMTCTDFGSTYKSESAMLTAERTLDIQGSAIATSNQAKGAAFVGSGIGAVSCAVKYSQAREEHTDTFRESTSTFITEIQTRYHWSPMRQIVFATSQLDFSSVALAELREIMHLPPPAREIRAHEFMRLFGSHVFGRVVLGGWYKYTAKAQTESHKDRATLEKAVATSMNWAVSVSASYVGLGGAASGSSGVNKDVTSTNVNGRELRCEANNQSVSIMTTTLGGTDGLPREEWLGSLQYAPQWRVIQREAPCPIWEIIRRMDRATLGLASPQAESPAPVDLPTMAQLFEKVWIQNMLKPSLDPCLGDHLTPDVADVARAHELLAGVVQSLQVQGRLEWSGDTELTHLYSRDPKDPTDCTGISLVNSIAASIYGNQLHCLSLVQQGSNWNIRHSVYDGDTWGPGNVISPNFTAHTDFIVALGSVVRFKDHTYLTAEFKKGGWKFAEIPPGIDCQDQLTFFNRPLAAEGFVPHLCVFKDSLYLIHANAKPGPLMVLRNPEAAAPAQAVEVKAVRAHGSVSTAVFQNKLYLAYRDDPEHQNRLCLTATHDGEQWEPPVQLPAIRVKGAPSLAVFGAGGSQRLYCAFQEQDPGSPLLIMWSTDGSHWSRPAPLGNECGDRNSQMWSFGSSPVLLPFTDQHGPKLICLYTGQDLTFGAQKVLCRMATYIP